MGSEKGRWHGLSQVLQTILAGEEEYPLQKEVVKCISQEEREYLLFHAKFMQRRTVLAGFGIKQSIEV